MNQRKLEFYKLKEKEQRKIINRLDIFMVLSVIFITFFIFFDILFLVKCFQTRSGDCLFKVIIFSIAIILNISSFIDYREDYRRETRNLEYIIECIEEAQKENDPEGWE